MNKPKRLFWLFKRINLIRQRNREVPTCGIKNILKIGPYLFKKNQDDVTKNLL